MKTKTRGNTRSTRAAFAVAFLVLGVGAATFAGCGGDDASTGTASDKSDASSNDAAFVTDTSTGDAGSRCGSSQISCGGECVNPSSDNANCGACGTTCAGGEVCSSGSCGATCAGSQTKCTLDGGAAYCANVASDNANCGGCGITCGAGQACDHGSCTSSCGGDADGGTETFCVPNSGAPYCATTQTDNANCGGCGIVCGAGQACDHGSCTSVCGGDADGGTETFCIPDGGVPYCASTQTDNANCGGCGITCGAGESCFAGMCVSSCGGDGGDGETLCAPDGGAPYCASTQTDNANCGGCGITCGAGQACVGGVCGCPTGTSLCDGICAPPAVYTIDQIPDCWCAQTTTHTHVTSPGCANIIDSTSTSTNGGCGSCAPYTTTLHLIDIGDYTMTSQATPCTCDPSSLVLTGLSIDSVPTP